MSFLSIFNLYSYSQLICKIISSFLLSAFFFFSEIQKANLEHWECGSSLKVYIKFSLQIDPTSDTHR